MKNFPSHRIHFRPRGIFHNFIVALDRMDSLPAALWIVLASLEVAGATMLWPSHHFAAYMITAFPLGLEALIIASSRWSEKSPSPFGGPFFLFSLGHASAALIPPLITAPITIILAVHVLIQFGLLWCMSYASLIEPYRVELREETIKLKDKEESEGKRVKIFLLADLHLDRAGEREKRVLQLAREFCPDLILWPGDFTNLSFVDDEKTLAQTRDFISSLAAIAPLFVSRGTEEVDYLEWVRSLVRGTRARLLENEIESIKVKGKELRLAGVPFEPGPDGHKAALEAISSTADGSCLVLLHHTPDLAREAARAGVRLYLAGHTHGGQIRFPLVGALYTATRSGRRWAHGSFRVDGMDMVVTRGVGMEGGGAPRMRFLCPPEVVGITLEF